MTRSETGCHGERPRADVLDIDVTTLLINRVRDELAGRLKRGASLAEVQDQVINTAPDLSEDERAALWLFAWSYRPRRRMAYEELIETRG